MENVGLSITQNKNHEIINPNNEDDKKVDRKRLNSNEINEDSSLKSKYPRENTTEEIKQKAYDNMNKFYDALKECQRKPPIRPPLQPFQPISRYNNNFSRFRAPPPLAKSFISSSSSGNINANLNAIYPISKGEIHKISEEPSELGISLELSNNNSTTGTSTTHYTTIVNCPRDNTYGARLLSKMGWRFGEGLGKDSDGIVKPMRFDPKINRKGLATPVEKTTAKIKKPEIDKNPVSILMEYCQKNKLPQPIYEDVEHIGPTNNRQFRVSFSILQTQSTNLFQENGKLVEET